MSYREGQDGEVNIGNIKFEVQNWTMNTGPGVADVSPVGSSGPKRVYTGFVDFTGTFTAAYQSSTPFSTIEDPFEKGSTASAKRIKLQESTLSVWWGDAVITNMSKTQDAPGVQQWSGDWAASNGRFVHATSTAT